MKVNKYNILSLILSVIIVSFLIGKILLTNIGIAGLILYWFTEKEVLLKIKNLIYSKEFWAISVLFWFSLIGLFYTELDHQVDGWKYVERRLSLLIFPLILLTLNISNDTIQIAKKILFIAVPFIGISGFIFSYYNYQVTDDPAFFYNNNLLSLYGHQAVYFSLFINVVLLFLLPDLIKKKAINAYMLQLPYLIFCLVFQYYLASRLSLIISIVLIGYILFVNFKVLIGKYAVVVMATIVLITSLFLALFSDSTIDRFKSLQSIDYDITSMEDEYNINDEGKAANWNGVTIRLAIWKCAGQLILDNLIFGVGTGDYKYELHKYFLKNGFQYGIKEDYTTHNQYIYLLVTYGIVGLTIFLVLQILVIKNAIKYEDKRFILFLLIFGVCFLTENVLNRNQGIISFSLFSTLFIKMRDKVIP